MYKKCLLINKQRFKILKEWFKSDIDPLEMEVRFESLPPVVEYRDFILKRGKRHIWQTIEKLTVKT